MVSLHLAQSQALSPSLAGMEGHAPEEARLMITDVENLLGAIPIKCLASFFFVIDDIPYDAKRVKKPQGDEIHITATLGYIPFSAESVEKRQALMDIIAGAGNLSHARFRVDSQQKIIMTGSYSASEMVSPDFLFYPLMQFLQDVQPFVKLIGAHL